MVHRIRLSVKLFGIV